MASDTRPYITVTNELFRHPKFRRMTKEARLAVLELWAHCNEFMTDGLVEAPIFEDYAPDVQELLLKVGWVDHHEGDYEMHDYLKHQKSKAEILALKAKKTVLGAYGGHSRHHVKKAITKPGCYWCEHPDEVPES